MLGTIARFEIDAAVRGLATAYTDAALRSLDAIHLATAQALGAQVEGSRVTFVSYDKRLLAAVTAAGLPAVSPGT